MIKFILYLILCCFSTSLSAQTRLEKLFSKPWKIIPIQHSADLMEVDAEGNILLLDKNNPTIYKYFFSSGYDSSLVFGGKSNRSEGFLHPIKVASKNRQQTFVLDDVQRRMISLSTHFRIVSEIDFLSLPLSGTNGNEIEEVFPISFDINSTGEIFVLNQLDNRILKFNLFGEVETLFGGTDYGNGSLYDPFDLRINHQNYVFVSDTTAQTIQVYDNFGTFRYTLSPKIDFKWREFRLFGNEVMFFTEKKLFTINTASRKSEYWANNLGETLLDIQAVGDFIYILLGNGIHLYKIDTY